MDTVPILAAIRRNKVSAALIATQIALTLAILCNALFIIEQRLALTARPTGADEANVFVIANQWIGNPQDLAGKLQGDLAALRSLPGVVDAYVTNSVPLGNAGATWALGLQPHQSNPSAMAAVYFTDEHALSTLGLKLVAGRNFTPDDIIERVPLQAQRPAAVMIITRALAQKLFPNGNALGQSVFTQADAATRIIGIVDELQVPWVSGSGWGSTFSDNSILAPFRFVDRDSRYVVRTRPGQLTAVMRTAPGRLRALDRARVISDVHSLAEARSWAYHDDRGLAMLLAVICALLLGVTALGIIGLTSYWVAQRRRHIGIRRALGATRPMIIRYFQVENLLIAAIGVGAGVLLAVALNMWMISSFEMSRLEAGYVLVGAAAVVLIGQVAALWPAVRASWIPPALAARSS